MQNVIISQALIKDRILICSAACTSDNGGEGRQNSRIVLFTLKLRRTACTRIQSKTTGRLTAFCTDPSIILPSPLLFILLRSAPSPPISAVVNCICESRPMLHRYLNAWAQYGIIMQMYGRLRACHEYLQRRRSEFVPPLQDC